MELHQIDEATQRAINEAARLSLEEDAPVFNCFYCEATGAPKNSATCCHLVNERAVYVESAERAAYYAAKTHREAMPHATASLKAFEAVSVVKHK